MKNLGSPIAQGGSGEVYAWNQKQVLKLFYAWCSPNVVRREMKNAQVVASKNFPTPKVIGPKKIDGRLGIIYERLHGPTMWSLLSTKPWRLFSLARQFAELHSQMHQQEGHGLRSVHASFRKNIEEVEHLSSTQKSDIRQLLNTLPDGTTLCHGDFHPEQVLLTAQGPMVVDWTNAHQGNPLCDVAITYIDLTIGELVDEGFITQILEKVVLGFFCRAYLTRYLELNPTVTQQQIKTWMILAAVARLEQGIPGEQQALLNLVESNLQEVVRSQKSEKSHKDAFYQ